MTPASIRVDTILVTVLTPLSRSRRQFEPATQLVYNSKRPRMSLSAVWLPSGEFMRRLGRVVSFLVLASNGCGSGGDATGAGGAVGNGGAAEIGGASGGSGTGGSTGGTAGHATGGSGGSVAGAGGHATGSSGGAAGGQAGSGAGGLSGGAAGGGGAAGSSSPSGNVLLCFGACPMGQCDSVVADPNEPSCSSSYPGPVGPTSTYCTPGASGSYCLEIMGSGIWGITCANGAATLSYCGGACSTDGISLAICGSLTGSGGHPDGAAGSG